MKHIAKTVKRKDGPLIINEKQDKPLISQEDLAVANQPVRAVVYVEVRDMSTAHIQLLFNKINESYKQSSGIHYLIPVRDGKISGDIIFENEILNMINQLCEIQDGKIVFKDDAKEVRIVREKI